MLAEIVEGRLHVDATAELVATTTSLSRNDHDLFLIATVASGLYAAMLTAVAITIAVSTIAVRYVGPRRGLQETAG
jgi:hypothetical protein